MQIETVDIPGQIFAAHEGADDLVRKDGRKYPVAGHIAPQLVDPPLLTAQQIEGFFRRGEGHGGEFTFLAAEQGSAQDERCLQRGVDGGVDFGRFEPGRLGVKPPPGRYPAGEDRGNPVAQPGGQAFEATPLGGQDEMHQADQEREKRTDQDDPGQDEKNEEGFKKTAQHVERPGTQEGSAPPALPRGGVEGQTAGPAVDRRSLLARDRPQEQVTRPGQQADEQQQRQQPPENDDTYDDQTLHGQRRSTVRLTVPPFWLV